MLGLLLLSCTGTQDLLHVEVIATELFVITAKIVVVHGGRVGGFAGGLGLCLG